MRPFLTAAGLASLSMEALDLWLAVLGAVVLALGLSAGLLRSRPFPVSLPLLALLTGVVTAPWGQTILAIPPGIDALAFLEILARITVAFAVTSIALRVDPSYYRAHVVTLATILGPVMVGMWLISAGIVAAIGPVGIVLAVVVGAILTPTDPVLANTIVAGGTAEEHIPERVRALLSAEAGINDGTASLFVTFALVLLGSVSAHTLGDWAVRAIVHELAGGIAIGLAVGASIGWVEGRESARAFLDETSVLSITVALTAFVLGLAALLGTNDLLAVFVAAAGYNHFADPRDEAREQGVQEVFNRLVSIPVFVVLGMSLPVEAWLDLGWRGPALAAGVLAFRRAPVVLLSRPLLAPLVGRREAFFVGWFGPMGIAAVYYALVVLRTTGEAAVWPLVSLVVVASILAHGTTATPATHHYTRFTSI